MTIFFHVLLFYSEICDRIQEAGKYILLSFFKICFHVQYIWIWVSCPIQYIWIWVSCPILWCLLFCKGLTLLQASQKSTLFVLSINDIECLSASPLYSRQYTKMAGSSHQTWSILKRASAISGVKSFRNSTTLHRFLIFLHSWLLSSLITFQFMVISHLKCSCHFCWL